jgi:hypothetical protein
MLISVGMTAQKASASHLVPLRPVEELAGWIFLPIAAAVRWLKSEHPWYNFSKLQALVSVAQLVEHRSVAPRVVGSIPIAHPNIL